ncbi:TetR/AcrR family transcriptional regulator [Pseudonocardia eucalypti]|uniref:TetR/AcrR family transcriptional regulator n=1 Tax=Pseudonocardia eucalypti TaxID=648755 RepID=A0ABP9Q777_9PSEU|nr:AcrR family transcriptional regulator [Pseudonocardia eucalypti]
MVSDTTSRWAVDGDLTAKARIRNAAFALHAAQGDANTTLREVAQAAGVTHGLVVHHFSNKDGLRRAVQQHMLELLRQALDDVPKEGGAAEIGRARDASVARMYAAHPSYLPYLRRALVDPAQLDTELLDLLADFTLAQVRDLRGAGVATSEAPEQVQALAIVLRELGPRLLEPIVGRLWTHLTGSTGPAPEVEIRLRGG